MLSEVQYSSTAAQPIEQMLASALELKDVAFIAGLEPGAAGGQGGGRGASSRGGSVLSMDSMKSREKEQ